MSMTLREFLAINLRNESRSVPVRVRVAVLTTYLCFIAVVTTSPPSRGPSCPEFSLSSPSPWPPGALSGCSVRTDDGTQPRRAWRLERCARRTA